MYIYIYIYIPDHDKEIFLAPLLTTMSFPANSGLRPTFTAAAAAAPDEIPNCNSTTGKVEMID